MNAPISRSLPLLSLLSLLLGSLLLAGCGGGASQVLGQNSHAQVLIDSRDIADLDLIIAPRQGAPGSADACSQDAIGFGCTRRLGSTSTMLEFDTRSEASANPYFVYVRNRSASAQRVYLEIRIDNEVKYTLDVDVYAGETLQVARIFRNNAGKP